MIDLTPQESSYPFGVHETLFLRALKESVPGIVLFGIAKPRYKAFARDYDHKLVCDFYFGGWYRAVVADIKAFTHEAKTELIAQHISSYAAQIKRDFALNRSDAVLDARIERSNEKARIDFELLCRGV